MSNLEKANQKSPANTAAGSTKKSSTNFAEASILDPTRILEHDLDKAEVLPVNQIPEYWTPDPAGEAKVLLFIGVRSQELQDINDPEKTVTKDCAFFLEPNMEKKSIKVIYNGSTMLVSAANFMASNGLYSVKYLGKRRNKNNAFMSDNWEVNPVKIQE